VSPHATILTALRDRRLPQARRLLRRRLVQVPGDARAWWLQGRLELAAGRPAEARAALETAVRLDPGQPEAAVDLGMVVVEERDGERAELLARRVLARLPEHGPALHLLGLALRLQGQLEAAAQALGAAAEVLPESADVQANLASCLEACNRNPSAAAAARAALALDPDHALAGVVLAQVLLSEGAHDEAGTVLDRVLSSERRIPPALRGAGLVARGKLRDRTGGPAEAYDDFVAGQAMLARLPAARAVDPDHFPALLSRIQGWLAARAPVPPPPPPPLGGWTPAFFVGFPRSGTTLALQLLSGHPKVHAIDERELLADTARELVRMRPGGHGYPAGIDHLSPAQRSQLARSYRERARGLVGDVSDGHVVVDKMPLNLPHLALAHALFPEAPVILALRDPRDCVLSAFMQTFEPTVAMVHCASLQSTARLYAAVMGLWPSLSALPGLRAHALRYEDVVDDVQAAITPVLRHLGLDWDPAVLRWRDRARGAHISTPSHQDVQQPIFRRARGRWRRYETQLQPVLPVLAPFVEAFGYGGD
jgi:cytochrome c-type biogenesis protein CcmH/NrfG